jgi:hypothetical protein
VVVVGVRLVAVLERGTLEVQAAVAVAEPQFRAEARVTTVVTALLRAMQAGLLRGEAMTLRVQQAAGVARAV